MVFDENHERYPTSELLVCYLLRVLLLLLRTVTYVIIRIINNICCSVLYVMVINIDVSMNQLHRLSLIVVHVKFDFFFRVVRKLEGKALLYFAPVSSSALIMSYIYESAICENCLSSCPLYSR